MEFKLEKLHRNFSKEELLADLSDGRVQIDNIAYCTDSLTRLATGLETPEELAPLLPWNWKPQ
jgi:hypothetical protein